VRLFPIVLSVLLLSWGVGVTGAAEEYVQTAVWGGYGWEDGRFNDPSGVAVDADGFVYVADTYNHRVQKFNSTGGFVKAWGGPGSINGTFQFADDIAVDGDGFVYVADRMNYRIQKFTSNGTFLGAWGGKGAGDGRFEMLSSVAASSAGDIFTVDRSLKRVQRFTSEGAFVSKWGSNGTDDGEFLWPYGVAVDPNGTVWVVDELNPCVQRFTSDGTFLAKWGTNGSAPGELNRPRRISVTDHVFVADSFNVRVQEFTLDGELVAAVGAPGSATNPFQFPVDVAPDGHGSIYVADAGMMESDVIKRFTRADASAGPAVEVTVEVSGDLGNTWQDADDAPGPYLEQVPMVPQFRYTIANTGTVPLLSCAIAGVATFGPLNPGMSRTEQRTYAWAAGQQFVEATATGTFEGQTVSDTDRAYYFGAVPAISIEARTNGEDADAPPGPALAVGSTVTWTYIVNNTGNVPLSGITVTDDTGVAVTAPKTALAPGESMTATANGTAVAGQFGNNGTATGTPPGGLPPVSATDPCHYHGLEPRVPNFTWAPAAPEAGEEVAFTDTSTGGPMTWEWSFGDGATSTAQHPVHVFASPGNYTVRMSAYYPGSEIGRDAYRALTVSAPPPAANFTATPQNGTAPLRVNFTDTSTGSPANWSWAFGDGTASTEQHPSHVYASAGNYTVTLTVANAAGANSTARTVTVHDPPPVGGSTAYYLVSTVPAGAEVYLRFLGGTLEPAGNTSAGPLNVTLYLTGTPVTAIVANLTGYADAVHPLTGYPDPGETVSVQLVLEPVPRPVPPSVLAPTDPDGDGRYEDVNGNGRADFADVVLYFNSLDWIAANEPVALFDCNGNGRFDFADVVWLFNRL
jgi:PKD repeat protein